MQFVNYSIQLITSNILQVNGDTLFMTGNFKEFKVESHSNESWDEHNAMASTAVCVIYIFEQFFTALIYFSLAIYQDYFVHAAGLSCKY